MASQHVAANTFGDLATLHTAHHADSTEATVPAQLFPLQLAAMLENSSAMEMRAKREVASAPMNIPIPFLLVRCQSPSEYFFNPLPLERCIAPLDSDSKADRASDSTAHHSVCTKASDVSSETGCVDSGSRLQSHSAWQYQTASMQHQLKEKTVVASSDQILGRVWCLATTPDGCRLVQAAFDGADNALSIAIASELRGRVWDAVRCQHANYVLQKCITKLTPQACQFIVDELRQGHDSAKHLARHRYGCRVFERLLEHCSPSQLQGFIDDVLVVAVALCGHPFANYVMQHILEHGSCDHRRRLVAALVDEMPRITGARHAPAVLSKALVLSCHDERRAIARALLSDPFRLLQLAMDRFGHVAVEQLLGEAGGEERAVRLALLEHVAELKVSRYGHAVARELQRSD